MNTTPIAIEAGSGNAYADLGLPDAQEMLVKAKLASKIAEIIQRQKLTQQQAAELLAMAQPKVSLMLRGQFRASASPKCSIAWPAWAATSTSWLNQRAAKLKLMLAEAVAALMLCSPEVQALIRR